MGEEPYGRPLKAVGGHCVAASARRQTDEQTDRQTERWTSSSCKVPLRWRLNN